MEIFIIDVDKYETVISVANLENGSYRYLAKSRGSIWEQSDAIATLIVKHRPSKVFIDEMGYGAMFKDTIVFDLYNFGAELQDDATVKYV